MKNVTIFIGSPRKNGSTRVLAAETERGLKELGIATETIFLNDLKIKGCQACYYCKKMWRIVRSKTTCRRSTHS